MHLDVARGLELVAADALDSHCRLADIDGNPVEYLPCDEDEGVDFIERPWEPYQSSFGPEVRAALHMGPAAEDDLPAYRSGIDAHFGQNGPTDGPSPGAHDMHGAEDGGRCVYLTFDDGPNLFCTPQILDVLAEHRAVATFCVIGEYAADHPELIRRIVADGHDLANHTMTHRDLSRCAPEEIRWEISGASDVITAISPQTSLRHLRAPYGIWSSEARAAAAALGLAPLDWTVDPRDWSRPGVDAIVETVLTHIRPGGVILLHDGCPQDELPSGDRTGLREQTVAALRRLIPVLKNRGFAFRTLPVPSVRSAADASADLPGTE